MSNPNFFKEGIPFEPLPVRDFMGHEVPTMEEARAIMEAYFKAQDGRKPTVHLVRQSEAEWMDKNAKRTVY